MSRSLLGAGDEGGPHGSSNSHSQNRHGKTDTGAGALVLQETDRPMRKRSYLIKVICLASAATPAHRGSPQRPP